MGLSVSSGRRFVCIGFAVFFSGAAVHPALSQTGADSSSLNAALAHYTELVRQMASDSIAALYTADGEVAGSGRAPIVGPPAIAAFLGSFSSYHVLADSMKVDSLSVRGDSGMQTGSFWQLVQLPSGDTVQAQGGFRATWVRDGHGGWRVRRMATVP